jgi:hypothetical protein
MRIGQLVLSVVLAGVGIWALAKGEHLNGASYLAFSVAWLLIAVFRDRLVAARPVLGRVGGAIFAAD